MPVEGVQLGVDMPPEKEHVIASRWSNRRGDPVELAVCTIGTGRKNDGIAAGTGALAMTAIIDAWSCFADGAVFFCGCTAERP